ncbi:MAG: prevent-host-death protein [Porphyromonas sp.]|nr:prevent-host-death protein [Porphyromonas sp.]
MNVITATEFRSNQRKYLELAEKEPVFITRSGRTPIALTPVDLSTYPTEREMEAIKQGLEDYEKGEYTLIEDTKNLWESIQ